MTTAIAVLRRHGAAVIALALLIAGEVELWVGRDPSLEPHWLQALLIPAWVLPLAARRLHPMAPLAGLAAMAADSLFITHDSPALAVSMMVVLIACWLLGHALWGRRLAVCAAALLVLIVLASAPGRSFAQSVLWVSFFAMASLAAGALAQLRDRGAEAHRQRAAVTERHALEELRRARAGERTRIARELHDVVAHSVSVMTVQAGAARLMIEADRVDDARSALATVEDTGREALGEMRRILGVLRSDMTAGAGDLEPRASLVNLRGLLAGARAAGQPVKLTVEGPPRDLAAGPDLAAYRVVQEALTNVRRHAPGAAAHVHVRYGDHEVALTIDNGRGERPPRGGGSGQGLLGMRERLAVYGGRVEAGPRPDGGFTVRAHIPMEAA